MCPGDFGMPSRLPEYVCAAPSTGESGLAGILSHSMGELDKFDRVLAFSTSRGTDYDSLAQSVAGAMSGAVSRISVAPFDVIKIRMQLQRNVSTDKAYRGLVGGIKRIACEEGMRGLFKGTTPGVALWMVYSAVQFPVYSRVFKWADEKFESPFSSYLVAGAWAAFVATAVSYPLDLIRTQFVFQDTPKSTTLACVFRGTLKMEGIVGFYRGFVPTTLHVVPNVALSFACYGSLKNLYRDVVSQELGKLDLAFIGAFSGGASKLMIYPLDTIKKRFQVNTYVYSKHEGYNGMIDCVWRMFREEGLVGFYKGSVATVVKSSVSVAVTFVSYEYFLSFMTTSRMA
mmetsp:Transcript_8082/g.13012  ORF Transcript_8082/g.13012 Transcript_8082/m.13012 type:complete len:343 (-) Transcript_8082:593-1621(-)